MRKIVLTLLVIVIFSGSNIFGQSFDWNVRGGLNLMKSGMPGSHVSVLYHFGLQTGVRIARFGFYGEALYSMNENQYPGKPVSYFVPSVTIKAFWPKYIFVEAGVSYFSKTGDSGVTEDTLNPDGKVYMVAGLGGKISIVEISLRTIVNKSAYGIIQVTFALKF